MEGAMEMSEGTRRVVGVSPPHGSNSVGPGMSIDSILASLPLTREPRAGANIKVWLGFRWMEVETF